MAKFLRALWPKKSATLSLLSLAPELRINIYQYLLPPNAEQSDYAGLFQSCRLIRQEFKYEALKSFTPAYQSHQNLLNRRSVRLLSNPLEVLETSTLELQIPLRYGAHWFSVHWELIPFNWLFLSKVTINLDAGGLRDGEWVSSIQSELDIEMLLHRFEYAIHKETIQIVKRYEKLKKPVGIKEIQFLCLNVKNLSVHHCRPRLTFESQLVPSSLCIPYLRRWTYRIVKDRSRDFLAVQWHRQCEWDMRKSAWKAWCLEDLGRYAAYALFICGLLCGAPHLIWGAVTLFSIQFQVLVLAAWWTTSP